MDQVRIGIIGIGAIGLKHADYLLQGEAPGAVLTAVSARSPARLAVARRQLGEAIGYFDEPLALIASRTVDAVLIATPHYTHTDLASLALQHGLHVLLEKPAGVYTRQVEELNRLAGKSGRVFGIMYQQRTDPAFQTLRRLLKAGELGEIKRTAWINTAQYRSQSYYDLDDWRGTWAGEGGGVLLNQALHQLDLWQWLCGMPEAVRAWCAFGKYHQIEVEDEVHALVKYSGGALGTFITSTGETPGANRLEIAGDRGKIVYEDERLTFWRLLTPERQFNRTYRGGFGQPEWEREELAIPAGGPSHAALTRDWVNAILEGTPLLAPGEEGINALQLANAMLLSTWEDVWVDLPVDGDQFYHRLQAKIALNNES